MEYIKDNYYSITQNYYDDIQTYIWKCAENHTSKYSHRICAYRDAPHDSNYAKNSSHGWANSILATIEEQHWLDCCIKEDNFITKEKAMLSFINPTEIPLGPDPSLESIYKKLLT